MKRFIVSGLAVMLFPTLVFDSALRFSNSVFSVMAFAGVFALLAYAQKLGVSGRKKAYAHVLGGVLSVLTAFGSHLEGLNGIPYGSPSLWLAIALYTHVFGQGIGVLWTLLEQKEHVFLRPLEVPRGGYCACAKAVQRGRLAAEQAGAALGRAADMLDALLSFDIPGQSCL